MKRIFCLLTCSGALAASSQVETISCQDLKALDIEFYRHVPAFVTKFMPTDQNSLHK
jgi:hypothetical protein